MALPAKAGADTAPFVKQFWREFIVDRKLDPENHPQSRGPLVAWTTKDSLHVMFFDAGCPLALCSACTPYRRPDHAFRLPSGFTSVPPAFAITKLEAKNWPGSVGMRFTLLMAASSGFLLRFDGEWDDQDKMTYSRWQYAALPSGSSSAKVAVAFPAAEYGEANDTSVILMGKDGFFRKTDWNKGLVQMTDLGKSVLQESWCAGSGNLVGTRSGAIYRFAPFPSLALVAKPFTHAVHVLDSSAASTDTGEVAVRNGDAWKTYAIPEFPHRAIRIRTNDSGLVGTFWGEGEPRNIVLKDEPARITSILPARYQGNLNGNPITGPTPSLSFEAEDAEGNWEAPVIMLIHGKDTADLAKDFRKSAPETGWEGGVQTGGCVSDGVCLQSSGATLSIRTAPDSVSIAVPVVRGTLKSLCPNTSYFDAKRDAAFAFGSVWHTGDRLLVKMGKDSLVFVNTVVVDAIGSPAGRLDRDIASSPRAKAYDASGRAALQGQKRGKTGSRIITYKMR
jgi:hypothetical protein